MNDSIFKGGKVRSTLVPPSRLKLEIFKRAKDGGSNGVLKFKF